MKTKRQPVTKVCVKGILEGKKKLCHLSQETTSCTLAQGINATPRVFSTKTQDFTPMLLKSLVDEHLLSISSL